MKLPPDTLAQLLPLPSDLPPDATDLPPATGAAFDSRRVRPGDAFFAFGGANTHGMRFAEAALAAGAAYVVSDRPHPRGIRVPDAAAALRALGEHARSTWRAPVVGVTGSAGKTSTKELLAAALDASASEGNLNTPHALACTLVDGWLGERTDRPLVLEMGIDRPGEMRDLVALVRPEAGVLTVVAPSHLDLLESVERVAREKSVLLERASRRYASVQAHGHLAPDLAAATTTYGLSPQAADVTGEIVGESAGGSVVRVRGTEIQVPLPSRAMAENAVAAFAVATALGVPPADAAARIGRARGVPGRLQPRPWGDGVILDDTYNSNPASAEAALDLLRTASPPRVAVLGDMLELGGRSMELHRELGRATVGLDRVYAHGPAAGALVEGNPRVRHVPEFAALVDELRALPREGTMLVKASRGMGFERIVKALADEVPA